MSGGLWDYDQYKIKNIIDDLTNTESCDIDLMDEQMKLNLIKSIRLLEEAKIHIHRLDWFLSGDDGKDTYYKRLKIDLEKDK